MIKNDVTSFCFKHCRISAIVTILDYSAVYQENGARADLHIICNAYNRSMFAFIKANVGVSVISTRRRLKPIQLYLDFR